MGQARSKSSVREHQFQQIVSLFYEYVATFLIPVLDMLVKFKSHWNVPNFIIAPANEITPLSEILLSRLNIFIDFEVKTRH